MEGSVAFDVLVVEGSDPTQQVAESDLGLGVTDPVQRSAAATVFRSQVHSLLFEVVQRDRLVSLSCDVQHVNAEVVSGIHIAASSQE